METTTENHPNRHWSLGTRCVCCTMKIMVSLLTHWTLGYKDESLDKQFDNFKVWRLMYLRWVSLHLTDAKSKLVQVMPWCRTTTNHYLGQCWLQSISLYNSASSKSVKYRKTMTERPYKKHILTTDNIPQVNLKARLKQQANTLRMFLTIHHISYNSASPVIQVETMLATFEYVDYFILNSL